jgi:putative ATP-dependent endonuclease of OLD family
MRVRRLQIERFRGIRSLDWRSISDTAALVGPGDSGKSTVLDALERVLSPRWNFPFDDSDFYDLKTDEAIVIRATVVDLPKALMKETKFGLALQVFDDSTGEARAPVGAPDEVYAIVIELRVDGSLEPVWQVIDAEGHEHPLHARDREALGMLRVGGQVDLHLGWNRGSVLTRLTETGDAVAAVLADATRRARAGLAVGDLDRLQNAATAVEELGRDVGVALRSSLVPHLDVGSLTFTGGSLSLHDGPVPLRRAGLGTRRLLAVAMQRRAAGDGGVTLIDEFEHGLEPHRIRRLLRKLRGVPPEEPTGTYGQLVLTTHAPVVVSELRPAEVVVVRRDANGGVDLKQVPGALEKVLPKTPAALLARRVIIAEGATELGLTLTLDHAWEDRGDPSFAYRGVVVVDGGGDTAPDVAGALFDLGYEVALFTDSDVSKPRLSRAKGAEIVAWPTGRATKDSLALDLPIEGFEALVALAMRSPKAKSPTAVRDAVAAALGVKPAVLGDNGEAWLESGIAEAALRAKFGEVAKRHGWFKARVAAEDLGALVAAHWDDLDSTGSRATLNALRAFAHHG